MIAEANERKRIMQSSELIVSNLSISVPNLGLASSKRSMSAADCTEGPGAEANDRTIKICTKASRRNPSCLPE